MFERFNGVYAVTKDKPEGEPAPKAAEKRQVDTERQKALRERVLTGNSTPATTIRGVR